MRVDYRESQNSTHEVGKYSLGCVRVTISLETSNRLLPLVISEPTKEIPEHRDTLLLPVLAWLKLLFNRSR